MMPFPVSVYLHQFRKGWRGFLEEKHLGNEPSSPSLRIRAVNSWLVTEIPMQDQAAEGQGLVQGKSP